MLSGCSHPGQGRAGEALCAELADCLQAEVTEHEPHMALFGQGSDGLDLPRSCCRAAERLLIPEGGFLGIEVGGEGPAVEKLLRSCTCFVIYAPPDGTEIT